MIERLEPQLEITSYAFTRSGTLVRPSRNPRLKLILCRARPRRLEDAHSGLERSLADSELPSMDTLAFPEAATHSCRCHRHPPPNDSTACLLLLHLHADDLSGLKFAFYTRDQRSLVADVLDAHVLNKRLTIGIHAPHPNWEVTIEPRLGTLSHGHYWVSSARVATDQTKQARLHLPRHPCRRSERLEIIG